MSLLFASQSFTNKSEYLKSEIDITLTSKGDSDKTDRNDNFILPHANLSDQTINIDFIYPIDKVTVNVINTTNNSILHSQVYYNTSFIQFNVNILAGEEYELNIIHDKWELSGYFEL